MATLAQIGGALSKQAQSEWFERGQKLHGQERWDFIQEGLRQSIAKVALVNRFLHPDLQTRVCEAFGLRESEDIPFAWEAGGNEPRPKFKDFESAATVLDTNEGPLPRISAARRCNPEAAAQLLPCCFLSSASFIAAIALRVSPGDTVLDLCAGPGAKAVVLSSFLFGSSKIPMEENLKTALADDAVDEGQAAAGSGEIESEEMTASTLEPVARLGRLVCNEPDRSRLNLLKEVLASFLPEELLAKRGRVTFTSATASQKVPPSLKSSGPFDKILVDVPCSPSRTLAQQSRKTMSGHVGNPGIWECSLKMVKQNADLALDLLRCAAALVKPGGVILYCAASLEGGETDEVICRTLQHFNGELLLEPGQDDSPVAGAEATAYGTIIIPDQGTRHGPLFFARLHKVPEQLSSR